MTTTNNKVRRLPQIATVCLSIVTFLVYTLAVGGDQLIQAATPKCTTSDSFEFSVAVDAPASYTAWARVKSTSASQVTLRHADSCSEAEVLGSQDWVWVRFNNTIQMSAGESTTALTAHNTEVAVDKLLFMVDPVCVPEGEDADNCAHSTITISISGIEKRVIAGADLRVSAEVQGASDPVVNFYLDNTVLNESGELRKGELYCAVQPKDELCDILPASALGVGTHTLTAVVRDGDRSSAASTQFEVVLQEAPASAAEDAKPISGTVNQGLRPSPETDLTAEISQADQGSVDSISPLADEETYGRIGESKESVPIFVIGQGSVLSETLSGRVAFSVPLEMRKNAREPVQFFVDDQLVGTLEQGQASYIYDTSQITNHSHQIKAVTTTSDGQVTAVEVGAVINNSVLTIIKDWLSARRVRYAAVALLVALALILGIVVARSYVRSSRLRQVTGVNTQRLEYIGDSRIGMGGYAALVSLSLLTLGGAMLMAPATPAYDGNASVLVELEDAKTSYEHTIAADNEGVTYVIVR